MRDPGLTNDNGPSIRAPEHLWHLAQGQTAYSVLLEVLAEDDARLPAERRFSPDLRAFMRDVLEGHGTDEEIVARATQLIDDAQRCDEVVVRRRTCECEHASHGPNPCVGTIKAPVQTPYGILILCESCLRAGHVGGRT